MRRCTRCGVDFNGTGMAPGSWCRDCLEVEGREDGNVWSRQWEMLGHGGTTFPQHIYDERLRQITELTFERKMSVPQISKQLGISQMAVTPRPCR